jgi:hypothetical protein
MLISTDIHPHKNIVYIGAMIIKLILESNKKEFDILDLYDEYKKKGYYSVSFYIFSQSISWLYMLKFIKKITNKGDICI